MQKVLLKFTSFFILYRFRANTLPEESMSRRNREYKVRISIYLLNNIFFNYNYMYMYLYKSKMKQNMTWRYMNAVLTESAETLYPIPR